MNMRESEACAWYIQLRLAALAAAKHTPRNGNKNNAENQTERRGGAEPSPLNRLGIGCRFSAVRSFLFIGFAVMVIS